MTVKVELIDTAGHVSIKHNLGILLMNRGGLVGVVGKISAFGPSSIAALPYLN